MKQALRSSGANATDKHITDVSLGSLFLMEAARKTDMVAKTSPQSSSHTVRDDNKDILKLMDHLLEKAVVKEDKNRATSHSSFTDLNTVGLKKLTTTSWLQDISTKGSCDGDGTADEEPHVMDENDQLLFEYF